MPSAVDSKSSEAWMLIMSDVLIWPLGSSVLTCSFTSHPNAVFGAILHQVHFLLFPPAGILQAVPTSSLDTAGDGCGARSLMQKPFCKGKVSSQRKPVKFESDIYVF